MGVSHPTRVHCWELACRDQKGIHSTIPLEFRQLKQRREMRRLKRRREMRRLKQRRERWWEWLRQILLMAPRVRRGHGLLDHFDHLGPRGMAGGEAGASARAGDAPEDRGRAGETRRTAAVVSAESLLSAIFPGGPLALRRYHRRFRRLSEFSIGTALAPSTGSAVWGRVWPGLSLEGQGMCGSSSRYPTCRRAVPNRMP